MPVASRSTSRVSRWGLPLATVVLWASAFPGIRAGLEGYGAGELALLRYLVASSAFGIYALVKRIGIPPYKHWPSLVVMGAMGFTVYNLALNYGERTVSAGPASFLVATVPIFTAILAVFLLSEPVDGRLITGLSLGLVGAAVIAVAEGGSSRLDAGAILILVAALSQAGYFVIQRRWLHVYEPLQLTAYGVWAGTLLMLPFLPALLGQIAASPTSATVAVVYLGLLPGAVAYVVWAHVLRHTPASRAAAYLYAVPVVAVVIAWIWLDETPRLASLIGGALALLGVALARSSTVRRPLNLDR